jgi:hypothetical protein
MNSQLFSMIVIGLAGVYGITMGLIVNTSNIVSALISG